MEHTTLQRMTRQRRVILEELRKLKTHPTAAELYELVRERLPKVSLGTIYRNLDTLSRCGVVQKLDMSGGQARYDGDISDHFHIRCKQCERVADLSVDSVAIPIPHEQHLAGFEITGMRIEYEGICPQCREKNAANN